MKRIFLTFGLCPLLLIGGVYLVHGYRVGSLKVEALALKSKMNYNFRNGFAGMTWNDEAGVILLSSTKDMDNLKQSWSAALQQWRQVEALRSKIAKARIEFPINRLWWKVKGLALGIDATPKSGGNAMDWIFEDLERSLNVIRELDQNRGASLTVNDLETAAIANFMRSVNLFADQPAPFRDTSR